MRTTLLLLLLTCCLAAAVKGAPAASDPDLDDYGDEDLPPTEIGKPYIPPSPVTPAASETRNATSPGAWKRRPFTYTDYPLEMAALAGLLIFVANIIRGSKDNKTIAVAFAKATCHNDGIIVRNFSFIGPGGDTPALITAETNSCYNLYASGRRFCHSLRARLNLIQRQDLIFRAAQLAAPQDDELEVEVEMLESCMPQLVLAVAPPKLARQLMKEESPQPEVAGLARKIEVARDRLPTWPADKLTVLSESPSAFYDLMPPQLVEQVFGRTAYEASSAWFRSMVISSEAGGDGKHSGVLKFRFALPPGHGEPMLSSMLGLVMTYIDLVGTYRLAPDQKKRAEKVRQEWASQQEKEKVKEGTSKEDERRAAKAEQEQDKLRKMTPEARQKYQDKKQKLQQQRSMSRMVRRK